MRLVSLSEASIEPRTERRKFVNSDEQNSSQHRCAATASRTGPTARGRILPDFGRFAKFGQIVDGSFSVVPTATVARRGAFFQLFRDLQD